ncbi:PAS domain S-box protein [Aurantiacibacter poecillastricola]|uniref:PAS domain S-box protein n=1 Tax=Aurantiacibacter poecillastricola TaxID=3064385 RepID=UPI00273E83EC|nr:PAS domain S-box protein [Aurantiacibacter sp. 219JJ12-13]MDP5261236.1 PAS domain S-box protein [Aurantiacibacter sp. 219JJ12-13]
MPESGSLSAERLGRIVEDAASEAYVFTADDCRFLLVNRGARENLGLTARDLAGMHPWDLKPEYPEERFRELVRPLLDGETDKLFFETVHKRKDGSLYDVDVSLQLIRTESRPVFYASIRDVTEQKKVWRELEAATARLDAILNNTTMAVFMMDEGQQCSFMNKAAEQMTGFTFRETQGRTLHDVIHHHHPDGRPFPIEECPIDRAFPEDYQIQGEEVFVHRDGHFYNVGFTASPMKDKGGRTIGTVIEARNIDEELEARKALDAFNEELRCRVEKAMAERESLEAQLVQSQKMEAIGQLTGGIAHDFNNLLQVIGGNLQLLQSDPAVTGKNAERVAHAASGVERGANLATQLLAFGRQQPLSPEPVNAGRVIRGMDDMFRRTLGEMVEIETVVAAGLWNCMVDPRHLENVLLNLVINARDAMGGEGKLTVEAGNASLDDEYIASNPDAQTGQYVVIAVTDNGCGIPEEDLARVFEPFFSTKETGRGTGLGLSMVFGFVKQSNGHIAIYSEVGQGTTVRIYLPRTRAEEPVGRRHSDATLAPGNNEVILVVEDDEEVRATVMEMLSGLGYRVVEAENADAALAIVNCGISIDLLFTDVVMPGTLKSTELARLAQKRLPGLAVLFTSGYTQNAIVHAGRLDEGVELISKPYTAERLSQKIRSVLAKAAKENDAADPAQGDAHVGELIDTRRAKRILVVEDEVFIRMSLVEVLEGLGHDIVEAGSLEQARQMVSEESNLDMVITDLSLPDGKANGFIAELLDAPGDTEIIIATGGVVPEELSAYELPVLHKPFSDDNVRELVGDRNQS